MKEEFPFMKATCISNNIILKVPMTSVKMEEVEYQCQKGPSFLVYSLWIHLKETGNTQDV